MTPQDRREAIQDCITYNDFPVSRVGRKADYTALQNYLDGKDAGDANLCRVETALAMMVTEKEAISGTDPNAAG